MNAVRRHAPHSRGFATIVIALAVPGLVACGHGPATKKDVIARADAICGTASRAIDSLAPPTSSTSLPALARYLRKAAPIVEREVAQLRALPRPPEDRALLVRYLAASTRAARDYRALTTAAHMRDRGAFTRASARLRASPAAGLAARYGLVACAGSAGSTGVAAT